MQIRSTHFSVGLIGSHKCEESELRERIITVLSAVMK